MDLTLNGFIFIEENENGYLVYDRKSKEEKTIPAPKFKHGEIVKTTTKHYSPKDFTQLISPAWTDNRGWVYGESYINIYGHKGGSGYWHEEDLYEPLTDPLLKLYAERLKHIEFIQTHETLVSQRKDFLNKIMFSLDIIAPKWREQFNIK